MELSMHTILILMKQFFELEIKMEKLLWSVRLLWLYCFPTFDLELFIIVGIQKT